MMSPGTLRVMRPGDTSEIIADGTWKFLTTDSAERARTTLPPDVTVSARFAFLTAIDGHVYQDLDSMNQMPIRFNLRKP